MCVALLASPPPHTWLPAHSTIFRLLKIKFQSRYKTCFYSKFFFYYLGPFSKCLSLYPSSGSIPFSSSKVQQKYKHSKNDTNDIKYSTSVPSFILLLSQISTNNFTPWSGFLTDYNWTIRPKCQLPGHGRRWDRPSFPRKRSAWPATVVIYSTYVR